MQLVRPDRAAGSEADTTGPCGQDNPHLLRYRQPAAPAALRVSGRPGRARRPGWPEAARRTGSCAGRPTCVPGASAGLAALSVGRVPALAGEGGIEVRGGERRVLVVDLALLAFAAV
jgi:hypothetical protein